PTYLVGFTISLMCLVFNAAGNGTAFPYRAWDVLSHYLILPRWPTLSRPLDGILWTLEIEFFFYFVCWLFSHKLRRFDVAIFLLSLLGVLSASAASLAAPVLLNRCSSLFAFVHWGSSMMLFLCFLLVGTAFHYFFKGLVIGRVLVMLQALLLSAFVLSW